MRLFNILPALLVWAVLVSDAGAKPRLPVWNIAIDTQKGLQAFRVEIAADEASRARGLMHRTHLAPNAGMLFDFGRPVMTAFWMKDTPISLDLLFVRTDGTISSIAANAVPNSPAEIASTEPIRAVIELNGGAAQALDIVSGDKVHAPIFDAPKGH